MNRSLASVHSGYEEAERAGGPSRIGGLRMASELVRPKVVSMLDRMLRDDRQSLRVEEVTVPDDVAPNRRCTSGRAPDRLPNRRRGTR